MAKNVTKKLDVFHWHEALDRSAICIEMVDRLILFHPAIESNKLLKAKATEAYRLLYEIYQEIGRLSMDKTSND